MRRSSWLWFLPTWPIILHIHQWPLSKCAMAGLCVADAPDESCWFILQGVFLRCPPWFYVPVMTAESFLSGLPYSEHEKDGFLIVSISGKLVKNTVQLLKSAGKPSWLRLCGGVQMNDSDAAKLRMRELLCAVHDLFLQRKNPTSKQLITVLKKQFLVICLPFLGSTFLLFPCIRSDDTMLRYFSFFKGLQAFPSHEAGLQ